MELAKRAQNGADQVARAAAATALAEAREPDVDQVARDALAEYATLEQLTKVRNPARFEATMTLDGRLTLPAQTYVRLPFDLIKGDQQLAEAGVINVAKRESGSYPDAGLYLVQMSFRNWLSSGSLNAGFYVNDAYKGLFFSGTIEPLGVYKGHLLSYLGGNAMIWVEAFNSSSSDVQLTKKELTFSGVKVADAW